MYQHNGITYLSEEENLMRQPELLREQSLRRKAILKVLAVVLAIFLIFFSAACKLASDMKKKYPTQYTKGVTPCTSSSSSQA